MSVEVVTPAEDHLLTTLDTVKQVLSITNSDDDDLLTLMIKSETDFIHNYTGRIFAREEVKESLEGNGLPDILLSRTPIQSVSKVLDDETEITKWEIYDSLAGILQREDGWTSTNIPFQTINRFASPYNQKKWHITYIGGYYLPGWSDAANNRDLPYDLERACIELVKTNYLSRHMDGSLKSYRIGDTAVSWGGSSSGEVTSQAALPRAAINILNYYRRAW